MSENSEKSEKSIDEMVKDIGTLNKKIEGMFEKNLDEVEAALIDVLDGNSRWYSIRANTGLSEERCKEIENLFRIVVERYNSRHSIT